MSSEAEFGLLFPPPFQVQDTANVCQVQKKREALSVDHCYIPSLTENGPRIAEMKLIFPRGAEKKWVGEELC